VAEADQCALHVPVSPGGFSVAIRIMSFLISAAVGGRPGRRRAVWSHFPAMSLWCQVKIVAGVTGKTSAQRRRGSSPDKAGSHERSASV
jgi:hypothetical protein